jgi:predicted Zn-dependent protease
MSAFKKSLIVGVLLGTFAFLVPLSAVAANAFYTTFLLHKGKMVRWETKNLRYAFVTRPTHFDGFPQSICHDMVPFPVAFTSGLSSTVFRDKTALAFAKWSRLTGITYVLSPEEDADILIGAQAQPIDTAYVNLEIASTDGLFDRIERAAVCLNATLPWRIDIPRSDEKHPELTYVLLHELGHVIGLDHTSTDGSIMGFQYKPRPLSPVDVANVRVLYPPN